MYFRIKPKETHIEETHTLHIQPNVRFTLIAGAPEGTLPVMSQRGVQQGDSDRESLGPLLFTRALQPVMEGADAACVVPG